MISNMPFTFMGIYCFLGAKEGIWKLYAHIDAECDASGEGGLK